MNKNIKITMIMLVIMSMMVIAIPFTPQGNIDLKSYYNLTNLNYVDGFTMADNIAADSYNITGINELSSTLVDTTNLEADNLESNLDGTGYNITANEVSTTLIDTTNLEADNLESHLDGTGYNITADNFLGDIVSSIGNFINLTVTNLFEVLNLKATNLESNLDGTGFNITANEVSTTLIDTTNLEADNLESNLDGTGYNLTIGNVYGATNINSTYFNGNSTWSHQSYPVSCSAGYGVSTIGDSNTCTNFMLGDGDTVPGNYVFQDNVTVEKLTFETDSSHYIIDNSTCICIEGDTSELCIC